MKSAATLAIACVSMIGLSGCSAGTLRAINDGLAAANGYDVYYPDQRHCNGSEVEICNGVYNGSAYYDVSNETREYCKVYVYMEDGTRNTVLLDPYEDDENYADVYNQVDRWEYICDDDRGVHGATLRDDGRWYW
jgi:hypothetical protein